MKYVVFLMSLIMSTYSVVVAMQKNIATLVAGRAQETGNTVADQRRFILIGGPCVGKTSILNRLKSLGHAVVRESATDIKTEMHDLGILAPWEDKDLDLLISDRIYARQVLSMKSKKTLIFFDRGPIDPLAYACYWNLSADSVISQRVEEILDTPFYETAVFLIAPLNEEFYENSTARHEDRETSERLGEYLAKAYEALGFNIARVPFGTIEERAQWILGFINP